MRILLVYLKKIGPNFLGSEYFTNDKGVEWFTIIFSPIFMLFVWFYMHAIGEI
jgi:hypothetical protein